MTKVARLFEEEKIEAVNHATNVADRNARTRIAKNMLLDGEDMIKVMKYTGYTRSELDEILKSIDVGA